MPIAYRTKQDNTSRRVWKFMENDAVRNGKSRTDAKHDCKQLRKMFQYGGSVIADCNGRCVYVPPGEDIVQYGVGVSHFADRLLDDLSKQDNVSFSEHLAETKWSQGVNQMGNQIMFDRLIGANNAN